MPSPRKQDPILCPTMKRKGYCPTRNVDALIATPIPV